MAVVTTTPIQWLTQGVRRGFKNYNTKNENIKYEKQFTNELEMYLEQTKNYF